VGWALGEYQCQCKALKWKLGDSGWVRFGKTIDFLDHCPYGGWQILVYNPEWGWLCTIATGWITMHDARAHK